MYERRKKADRRTGGRVNKRTGGQTHKGTGGQADGEKLTPLSELGEFGLIDRLTKDFPIYHSATIKGVGDDAAVIDTGTDIRRDEAVTGMGTGTRRDEAFLISTDLLVEGIHFDMVYTPLKHLGYKAVAVNVSDIAAMNGTPTHLTVSVAVSSRFSVEALEELYEGIRLACQKYRLDLVGGDTSTSTGGLLISVTILGKAWKEEVVYRSGAKPGDLLCVTGDLGSAYIGLLLLEREKKVFQANPAMQPQLSGLDYPVGRFLKPEARTDIRSLLQGIGVKPTSMIDISDGLASEALHLCRMSDTGCRIYEDKIPIDPQVRELAMEFKIIPSVAALSGGEDYELLFTVAPTGSGKIPELPGITVIGHMTPPAEGRTLITPDGKEVEITAQGWTVF
jgi:thiamine-monophosphate kinase